LTSNIEELEIKKVVHQCGASKILTPNGFKFEFIESNLETMKCDIIYEVN